MRDEPYRFFLAQSPATSLSWLPTYFAWKAFPFHDLTPTLRARLMAVPPTVRASSSKSPASAEPPAISMLFLGTIVSLV